MVSTTVLLFGCAGTEPDDEILGRWAVASDGVQIEFLPDGTFGISGGTGAEQGRWERMEDGRIVLETMNLTGKDATPQVLQIDMFDGGNEAFVTVGGGETTRMRRIDQP